MIKIDAQKFLQPRKSRGGRTPVKITMSEETREQIAQIIRIGPGGHLSAFVDWACRLLLYTLGTGDILEPLVAITEMLEVVTGGSTSLMSSRLEALSLNLLSDDYSITREMAYEIALKPHREKEES